MYFEIFYAIFLDSKEKDYYFCNMVILINWDILHCVENKSFEIS